MRKFVFTSQHILLALILLVLLGAFLRVNASLHTTVISPLRGDALEYFSYAYNLRHEGIYSREPRFNSQDSKLSARPDAFRSPGYPLALLPFAGYVPTNKTILDITLVQAALGVLMIPLVFLLALPFLPRVWALLPTLLVAISPQLVTSGTYVLSETLFTFLFLVSLVCLQAQFRHPRKFSYAVLSGVLLGLASITRPTLQYFLPVVLLLIFTFLPVEVRRRQGIALALGFLVAFSPWLIRNIITLGIISDPTITTATLLHGHYLDFMYQGRPETLGYPYRFDPRAAEIGASVSTIVQEILHLFKSEPFTYIRWYLIGKPIGFLSWGDVAATNNIFTYPTIQSPYFSSLIFKLTKTIMQFSHWLWVILALITTILIWMPFFYQSLKEEIRNGLRLFASVVLYFLVIHIIGFPIARYNIPLLPVLFILATYSLFWLTKYTSKVPS